MPSRAQRLRAPATCVAAGALLCLSLPPFGFWPLSFVGLVLVDRLIADQPAGARFKRGWLVAMACFVPSLSWMIALTAPGYLIACIAYAGMLGAGVAAAPPGRGRWPALAGTWSLAELVRWTWPFGGVPLGNLTFGQVSGPLAPVLRIGGPLLLLVLTVLVGSAAAAAVRRAWRPALGLLAVVAVTVGLAQLTPRGHDVGSAEIALVQGGGEQGTRQSDETIQRAFEAQVTGTDLVRPPVDLVLWPEDVVDTPGPLAADPWGDVVRSLSAKTGAPLLVGTVEDVGTDRFRNSVQLFDDTEVLDRYDKVHRVPFGEWVPLRALLEPIAGDALPNRDATTGTLPATIDVPGPIGRTAVPISWEVFFPDRTREGVEAGGRLVLNPTNGSSFTGTIVQTQQVAASRMRAIETGRWVAQVAPTGFSAVVDDQGRVLERTGVSEQAVIQREVRLREGLTIYTRWGNLLGLVASAVLIAAGWAVERRPHPRRG